MSQRDHKRVENLASRHVNSSRDVQRQVAREIGIGQGGVGKNSTAANAQSYVGDLKPSSGVAKFQSAGMGPK